MRWWCFWSLWFCIPPVHCSCLENPGDRGAWWAAVYRVAQSRTRLKQLSSSEVWEHLEDPHNSVTIFQMTSAWWNKSHACIRDPYRVQELLMDFKVSEHESLSARFPTVRNYYLLSFGIISKKNFYNHLKGFKTLLPFSTSFGPAKIRSIKWHDSFRFYSYIQYQRLSWSCSVICPCSDNENFEKFVKAKVSI